MVYKERHHLSKNRYLAFYEYSIRIMGLLLSREQRRERERVEASSLFRWKNMSLGSNRTILYDNPPWEPTHKINTGKRHAGNGIC